MGVGCNAEMVAEIVSASEYWNISNYWLFNFKVNICDQKSFPDSTLAYQQSSEDAWEEFILSKDKIS